MALSTIIISQIRPKLLGFFAGDGFWGKNTQQKFASADNKSIISMEE